MRRIFTLLSLLLGTAACGAESRDVPIESQHAAIEEEAVEGSEPVPIELLLAEALRRRFVGIWGPHDVATELVFAPGPAFVEQPVRVVNAPTGFVGHEAFRLERFEVAGVADHAIRPPPRELTGYAAGAGLLDADGDGDLDLFLGRLRVEDPEPCVYRNDSTPGDVTFTRVAEWCLGFATDDVSAMALDLEGDGVHELVLLALNAGWLVRFAPAVVIEQLDVSGSLPRQQCPITNGLPFDLDLDGVLDLFLPCLVRVDVPSSRFEFAPRVLLGDSDGNFAAVDPAEFNTLGDDLNTLAAGAIDANSDGLFDVVLAVDTFSNPRSRNRTMEPGGVYYRCAPDAADGCRFAQSNFLATAATWGSYMGISVLHVAEQRSMYLTDWGYNRLLQLDRPAPWLDSAIARNADQGGTNPSWIFTWGALVEDLDNNGTDDLLLAQGCVPGLREVDCFRHYDVALLQRPDGNFVAHGGEIGLPPHNVPDESTFGFGWSSRGWLRADLDGDGTLELVQTPYSGAPRFYRLVERTPSSWCTVRPLPRYVPSFGWGIAISATREGPWREYSVQGMMRVSPSPWITSRDGSGFVRFASGAVVPYSCGENSMADVAEPAWLSITNEGQRVHLSVDRLYAPLGDVAGLAAELSDNTVVFVSREDADDDGVFVVPAGTLRVMPKFGEQWVARWFALEP